MLFGYILLSYLISGIGFLLYSFFLQKKGSPSQRKMYLYTILAVSLALPYPLLKVVNAGENRDFLQEYHPEEAALAENTIEIGELQACYQKALNKKEFCACEDLEFNNIIIFQEDQFLETCIGCKEYINVFSLILIAIILIVLIARIAYLFYIVKTSRHSSIVIDGKQYTVLNNPRTPIAASFRLLHKYIIWDSSLDQLNENEKKAVCYHEIAHLKNLDTWEQICLSILRMFWFANPVFYKIRNELKLVSEYLADAFAVAKTGNPQSYASLLIRLKEQQNNALYQGFGSEDLKSRILNIIRPSNRHRALFASIMLASLVIMGTTGVLAAPPIKTQMKNFKQYEILQNKKSETGEDYFCKTCIIEELEANCSFD